MKRFSEKVGTRLTISAATAASTTPLRMGERKMALPNSNDAISGIMTSPAPAGAGTPVKKL